MNNEYDYECSVEPNYYKYKASNILTQTFDKKMTEYKTVYLNAYDINNEGKYPFQRFLLTNTTFHKMLDFPQINISSLNCINNKNYINELLNYSKVCLFDLFTEIIFDFDEFNRQIEFTGFYEFNNNLYIFYDITKLKLKLNDVFRSNNLWLALMDELTNLGHVCNIKIHDDVTHLFVFGKNSDLCFLINENETIYEIPIVSYVRKPENKLNFTYTFGQIQSNKNSLFGPYYYFTNYYNSCVSTAYLPLNNFSNYNSNLLDIKYGIVRFAIFTCKTKYIENNVNDSIDTSVTKQQRLIDSKFNRVEEQMTMRITDHDGKWSENYDSIFLGRVELDDGNKYKYNNIIAVKDYLQQVPLSYHFIDNITVLFDKKYYSII